MSSVTVVYLMVHTNVSSLQPLEVWKRKVRIVRMLCGVCMVLRQYALDAGLMSHLMLPTTRRRRTTGPKGDIVEFNLDDYRVQKEVCERSGDCYGAGIPQ